VANVLDAEKLGTARGLILNNHFTDVESPHPPPRAE
jgi:hypothetical protein